ncbi:YciI family protein [Phytoactinopolyspora halotolerans]|uniref:YciI family protein n=1 Tax=Phytoactinopolyspora halotolerans TaxID=1981512 RepID=A0A6L9SDL1_9ACTN|nr:YciI family protein [Phytoactinopolyspora halotolerans]NEE02628.1 YciI family protein [Phytoactinopolyspora halotolerans]
MKYMVLIYSSPRTWNALSQEERERIAREHFALDDELAESGEYLGGNALADQVQSRVVRVSDGAAMVTDGPYLEAKEHLAGYDIIECDSMERALEIAARNPHARLDGVEVRPIMDLGGTEM